jgi:hypothetical protein
MADQAVFRFGLRARRKNLFGLVILAIHSSKVPARLPQGK